MRQLADEGTVQLLHGKGAFVRKVPAGSGKLAEIGLVYPASRIHLMETEYLNQILTGVIAACDHYQIDLQIVSLRTGVETSAPIAARDIVLRVDGVILLGVLNEPYIAQFASEAVPLVLIDAQSPSPIHSISIDNASAVDQTMDHLYALGHRRIAYMDCPEPGRPGGRRTGEDRIRRHAGAARGVPGGPAPAAIGLPADLPGRGLRALASGRFCPIATGRPPTPDRHPRIR